MVSPFMAFAKGAFEGYNRIQDEERAAKAARDLERYKQSLVPDETRYFQAMGSSGMVDIFPMDKPGDYSDQELFDRDLSLMMQHLDKNNRTYRDHVGLMRRIDDDPVLSQNVDKKVRAYMQKWFMDNTKEYGSEGNRYRELPYASQNEYLFNHNYYGKQWQEYTINGMFETLDLSNQPPETVAVVSVDNNKNISSYPKTINSNNFGFVYDVTSQQHIPMSRKVFDEVLVPELNRNKGNRLSPNDYLVEYNTNPIRFYTAPILVSSLEDNEYLTQSFQGMMRPNEQITYGHLMKAFVQSRIPDRRLLQIFNNSVEGYNSNVEDKFKITTTDIYKAFKLSSSNKMEKHTTTGKRVWTDSKSFINQHFSIDLDQMAIRADAGQSVIKTVQYAKANVKDFEDTHGYFPPLMKVIQGGVSLISGIGGEGGLVRQTLNFFDSIGEQYSLKKDVKIMNKMSKYAQAAETEVKGMELGDSALLEGATTAARHTYYKYMLAYQLAVAIQGGTGGRTVSDQDVENMMEAIGDTLFANGRIQMAVLDTIEAFAQDIVDKNQFWSNSQMSVDAAYAADAMDRFMYGGVSVNKEYGSERTEYAKGILQNRIAQIAPEEYEKEMSGLKDPTLNRQLVETGIIEDGEIVSYRRGEDFSLNVKHHIMVNDKLTIDEYYTLVDRHYSGNRQAQETYKSKDSYRRYLANHDMANQRK